MLRELDSPSPECIVVEAHGTIGDLDLEHARRIVGRVAYSAGMSLVARVLPIRSVDARPGLSDVESLRKAAARVRKVALVTDDEESRSWFYRLQGQAAQWAPEFQAQAAIFDDASFHDAVAWACARDEDDAG